MRSTRTLITMAGFAALFFSTAGCSEGAKGIPVDKTRAKEHIISLRKADGYRSSFASAKDSLKGLISDSVFLNSKFNLPVAEMFNRDAIALLLNQEGADGIRIYFGRDDEGYVRLVLLPVDKNGKDIRKKLLDPNDKKDDTNSDPKVMKQTGDLDGEAVEVGQRCPTVCD
jgi:hypothetical protein